MTERRIRPSIGRVSARAGAWTLAVGAGAVIACSATAPAWASEDGTSAEPRSAAAAPSKPSQDRPSRASAERRADADTGADASETRVSSRPSRTRATDGDDPDTDTTTVEVADAPEPSDPGDVEEPAPESPVAAPALWSLVGSARPQDSDDTATAAVPGTATEAAPTADTTDPTDTVPAAADVPVVDQPVYTGRPSFVQQVVIAGLNVLKVVLKPFGGLLAFTSLKIPFFTDGVPPFFLTPGLDVERTEFDGMKVWSLTPRRDQTDQIVVALHGGAYVATASIFHWWTYADMARDTGATVVVPLQTLVPRGGTAATEVPRTADFLTEMIDAHGAHNVSVFGDSAGGGLALAAVQELNRRSAATPSRLVLLAPWLDVSMSDPRSAEIRDPLLDIPNLVRSGAKWAGSAGVTDPLASPLFGSLEGLPPTYVYSSSRDLLTVDTLRLRERVGAEGIPNVEFRLRAGLIHDWFTFPFLPDAHEDRAGVYSDLLGAASPVS